MEDLNLGKTDLGFYIGMVVKWYWIVLIPFALSMLVGIYLVLFSQRYYEARTVILVQPPKLPADVVKNIVVEDINTRVSTLAQRIRSRTNLEKIISDFDLFADEKSQAMYMEDKVDILRKNISVKLTNGRNRNAESFAVTYRGTDPQRVMKITQSLASYIIDENLKIRETQVLGTNSFLEDEMESMRRKLVETETGLKEYRERYMGGLPEQLNSNLRILDTLNDQLSHARDEIRISKYRLDGVLQIINTPQGSEGMSEQVAGKPETNLARLRNELDFRLKRYTEFHPDVLQLKASIAQLEAQERDSSQAQSIEQAKAKDSNQDKTQAIGQASVDTAQVRKGKAPDTTYERQRRDILADIGANEKEQEKLLSQIAVYKKRVEDTPKREQEILSLQRDYENIRTAYHSLLGRQLEAQIAVNMEKKQKGEQFRIIDPARVPQKPVKPDIKKLVCLVLAAGLGLGCGVVALLEFLMPTFRGPKAVEGYTSIPVLAMIPSIEKEKSFRERIKSRIAPVGGVLVTMFLLCGLLGAAYIKG